MRSLLLRGAAAGAAGGVASVLTLLLLGESKIRDAIALEEAASATEAASEAHGEMFSRTVQVIGGSLGVLLFGILLGTIFAVVFAANRHRLRAGNDWQRSVQLGALAFVSVYLVPFLKYPPNPPAVGNPDTVNQRTIAYLSMLTMGIVATALAGVLARRLRAKGWGTHLVQPAAVGAWVALVGISYLVLPANPDAIEVDATLIWQFRLASLAGQAATWAVMSCVFGWLLLRAADRADDRDEHAVTS